MRAATTCAWERARAAHLLRRICGQRGDDQQPRRYDWLLRAAAAGGCASTEQQAPLSPVRESPDIPSDVWASQVAGQPFLNMLGIETGNGIGACQHSLRAKALCSCPPSDPQTSDSRRAFAFRLASALGEALLQRGTSSLVDRTSSHATLAVDVTTAAHDDVVLARIDCGCKRM